LKDGFLELLRCPECKGSLALEAGAERDDSGAIVQGRVGCVKGHHFPIERGIPRFVDSEQYAENFGFEWNLHRRTQLDTETVHESETAFRLKTGFTPADLKGKVVLDAGCGMGRYSDVVSRWGATVASIDLSLAVDAAYQNLGGRANVNVAQADIFNLPFGGATFDCIFSIGVLHHTPSTRRAFEHLTPLLKPGGQIAIWVYSSYDRGAYFASDIWRKVTTRMPKRMLYALSHVAVPLHHLRRVPVVGHSTALFPVSGHPNPTWRVLDTFDWYSPHYQWKHTNEEVRLWFEEQGMIDIRVLDAPIAVRGQKAS
jgi:2-polyprenyl-3-methyl-5-hydroxy-6-metoxy-1,4-benzoquinol methylase